MKKLFSVLVTVLLLLVSTASMAGDRGPQIVGDYFSGVTSEVRGLSVGGAMSGATVTIPATAVTATVFIYGGPVRWKVYDAWDSGYSGTTPPTMNNGAIAYTGDIIYLDTPYALGTFGLIADSSAGSSGASYYVVFFGRSRD